MPDMQTCSASASTDVLDSEPRLRVARCQGLVASRRVPAEEEGLKPSLNRHCMREPS
jgi:hypothetical protein